MAFNINPIREIVKTKIPQAHFSDELEFLNHTRKPDKSWINPAKRCGRKLLLSYNLLLKTTAGVLLLPTFRT